MKQTPEHLFYDKAKTAVERYFMVKGYSHDFQITGHPKNRKIPARFLRSAVLQKYQHLPTPDMMGLVWREFSNPDDKKLVVVEFKKRPCFRDIFQAKGYDELFNSDFTLLLSQYPFRDSSRRVLEFVKERPEILNTNNGQSHIVIKYLSENDGHISLAMLGSDVGIFPVGVDWEI